MTATYNEKNVEAHIYGPWHVNIHGQPDYWWRVEKYNPLPADRYAKCSFYFRQEETFRPIVFSSAYVHSLRSWNIWRFYDGLKRCALAYNTQSTNWCGGFLIKATGNKIVWGCREFDIKDIVAMKQLMEKKYDTEQLARVF